jgi:hypothetical protein
MNTVLDASGGITTPIPLLRTLKVVPVDRRAPLAWTSKVFTPAVTADTAIWQVNVPP